MNRMKGKKKKMICNKMGYDLKKNPQRTKQIYPKKW